ncbi:LysR substrate-binding domain-containing protein [Hafnia paralvei]|uniref:LysR substrate-binding domain-containing protein n=1 Tax=Hafnia paralvei TaxID=546367 RepID=UPI003466F5C4
MTLNVTPCLITKNMRAVIHAAIAGIGITCLPRIACADTITAGKLVHILPEWTS